MEKEIWKDVKGYEEYYQISNLGRVKSKAKVIKRKNGNYFLEEKILKQSPNSKGYLRVCLCVNNKRKSEFVHRMVAIAFIENPNNFPIINHKDENHLNNKANNLEWCTYQYNNTYNDIHHRKTKNYNYEEVVKKKDYKKIVENMVSYRRKTVYQYDLNWIFIKEWKCGNDVIKEGVATKSIYDCLIGKQHTHKGFRWSYERR